MLNCIFYLKLHAQQKSPPVTKYTVLRPFFSCPYIFIKTMINGKLKQNNFRNLLIGKLLIVSKRVI